jgi:hypothetical protein
MHNGCVFSWFFGTTPGDSSRKHIDRLIDNRRFTVLHHRGKANWLKYSYMSPAVMEGES